MFSFGLVQSMNYLESNDYGASLKVCVEVREQQVPDASTLQAFQGTKCIFLDLCLAPICYLLCVQWPSFHLGNVHYRKICSPEKRCFLGQVPVGEGQTVLLDALLFPKNLPNPVWCVQGQNELCPKFLFLLSLKTRENCSFVSQDSHKVAKTLRQTSFFFLIKTNKMSEDFPQPFLMFSISCKLQLLPTKKEPVGQ